MSILPTAQDHVARRARLGISVAKPIVIQSRIPKPKLVEPEPVIRDIIDLGQWHPEPTITVMPPRDTMDIIEYMPAWKRICHEVCRKHRVRMVDLISHRRHRQTCAARQEAMWRMRHETPMSLPQIGQRLGGRDHTTVYHGINRYQAKIDSGEVTK